MRLGFFDRLYCVTFLLACSIGLILVSIVRVGKVFADPTDWLGIASLVGYLSIAWTLSLLWRLVIAAPRP